MIREAEIDFSEGLNILTGETGAGKSILIGSMTMALGGKVPREMVREDADYALSELVFTADRPEIRHKLEELGTVSYTHLLCFDFPKDKVVWDVGHQSYTHKLLTGRKSGFDELRKYGGMSGFPKRKESDCDCFDTGHSSTSISAGIGPVSYTHLDVYKRQGKRGTERRYDALQLHLR